MGLVFTPLQVVAFATLPVELRTDGTALFSLLRNVGSSIGISVTSFLLAQNTQIVHAALAAHVTPFDRMLQTAGAYLYWNSATQAGLAALNAEVTRQAYGHRLYGRFQAYASDLFGGCAAGVTHPPSAPGNAHGSSAARVETLRLKIAVTGHDCPRRFLRRGSCDGMLTRMCQPGRARAKAPPLRIVTALLSECSHPRSWQIRWW